MKIDAIERGAKICNTIVFAARLPLLFNDRKKIFSAFLLLKTRSKIMIMIRLSSSFLYNQLILTLTNSAPQHNDALTSPSVSFPSLFNGIVDRMRYSSVVSSRSLE